MSLADRLHLMVIASARLAAAPKPAPPSDHSAQAALCSWQSLQKKSRSRINIAVVIAHDQTGSYENHPFGRWPAMYCPGGFSGLHKGDRVLFAD